MEFKAHYSGSKGNFYSVESTSFFHGGSGEVLLIDPGVSLKQIRKCVDMHRVVGALVSHSHKDHCRAVPDLMRLGVDCYMTGETARGIPNGTVHHRAQIFVASAMFPIEYSVFYVHTFQTHHDCPGSVGFFVAEGSDRLLYVTDAPYVQPRFAGLTHVALECNWSNETMADNLDPHLERRIRHNHMSLDVALGILQANDLSRVREIWLLHLSDANSDAEMFRDRVQKATGKPVFVA